MWANSALLALLLAGAGAGAAAGPTKALLASRYNYDKVLEYSLLFYEAQRSGKLPPDNRIKWRGDSALNDRGQKGEDLAGGYYDAGDFVKFSFTMAYTTTLLAWGMLSYRDAYKASGQLKAGLSALKWSSDYFVKCHTSPNELYAQVGDFSLDVTFWGRPEELNMSRPSYKIDAEHPGSELAGETAAALAAVSLVFRHDSPDYSQLLLHHARDLYRFASEYRGLYHETIKQADFYESTDYGDELTWAAAWLYKATDEAQYLDEAQHHYSKFRLRERPNEFFYQKKVAGVQVLMAQLTRQREYLDAAQAFCDFTVDEQKRTPKGLVYIDKHGTLSHAANVAFVCLEAAEIGINPAKYISFARQQINYMLGDAGRSYVVGLGQNPPKQPFHAPSSCPDRPAPCGWEQFKRNGPNPQVLYGALVSGPDENDYYQDSREDFVYNEVTLYFNAGFQSAVAGLRHYELLEAAGPQTAGKDGLRRVFLQRRRRRSNF